MSKQTIQSTDAAYGSFARLDYIQNPPVKGLADEDLYSQTRPHPTLLSPCSPWRRFQLLWWSREWWRAPLPWCDPSSSPVRCSGTLTGEPACTSRLKSSLRAGRLHSAHKHTQTLLQVTVVLIPKEPGHQQSHVLPCFMSTKKRFTWSRQILSPCHH